MAEATDAQGANLKAPYVAQDVREVAAMVRALEDSSKNKKKGALFCKKTSYEVKGSPDGIMVQSWKMQESDYKKRDLPTYARGLFTTRNRMGEPEIAVRGYDKFFNTGEVHETKWENILSRTQGPYELTLKENGCIIFISGLEDGTLLVCSKHSTGERDDADKSHAIAGERLLEAQLAAVGRTTEDLARDLRARNATAVAELCDDSFEEHVLAYGADKAGLYLHGINLNLPQFATYPSIHVQNFANEWGFKQVGLIVMDDINKVKAFLEEVAESGAHEGRDVEGFVIRCRESYDPTKVPYRDWFFKYKFEEPYLMYRQWRECTKALISGKPPRFKKHVQITEEYLLYARKRLQADPKLGKAYMANHGIIALRDDFLAFKNLKGSDAANIELRDPGSNAIVQDGVTKDLILLPVATIGCGKTTIAIALTHLFLWGIVQNDNIQGKGRPPRFTKQVLDLLRDHPAVIADRNNAQRHERKQFLNDVMVQHKDARVVALYFDHNNTNLDEVRRVTQERVLARGDNHQTIHAATDKDKFLGVMEGFIDRFEPVSLITAPDSMFDNCIMLDPTKDSRANLETVCRELHRLYPGIVREMPTAEKLDAAINYALNEYAPGLKHSIPDRGPRKQKNSQPQAQPKKKKPLEYVSVEVPSDVIKSTLDQTFIKASKEASKFYTQLTVTRRVQPKFHVTLMHRASNKEQPELWNRYTALQAAAEASDATGYQVPGLGSCGVELERVVFDNRVMAIVVRLNDDKNQGWECVNRIAHITVGTAADGIKPRESNDMLARWNTEGSTEENGIHDLGFDNKVYIDGHVKGVLSR